MKIEFTSYEDMVESSNAEKYFPTIDDTLLPEINDDILCNEIEARGLVNEILAISSNEEIEEEYDARGLFDFGNLSDEELIDEINDRGLTNKIMNTCSNEEIVDELNDRGLINESLIHKAGWDIIYNALRRELECGNIKGSMITEIFKLFAKFL